MTIITTNRNYLRQFVFILLIANGILICSFSCQDTESGRSETEHISTIPQSQSMDLTDQIGKDYLIDDQHSYIGFKIKYFGTSPVRGRFNRFDGTLFYDEKLKLPLSVTVIIDINSINTGDERRDSDLRKEDVWFNAPEFPLARFQSTQISLLNNGGFVMDGELTIKGITKKEAIEFAPPSDISRDWADNEQLTFSGLLSINREDYNVAGGEFWRTIMENGLTQLSDKVEIELDLHCRRPDYQARYETTDSSDVRKIILDQIRLNGINSGIGSIESMHTSGQISSGALSTIGYTLYHWNLIDQAQRVFETKVNLFGPSSGSFNQIGLTQLSNQNMIQAKSSFEKAIEIDSTNSRGFEYLRLIHQIQTQ